MSFRDHHVSATIRSPLPFVYNWCTDYTPDDFKYGGEVGQRRILSRSARKVIFENIYDVGKGWGWERHIVTLKPPSAWHSEGWGNYSISSLDYRLTALSDEMTRLDMDWKSKPGAMSQGKRASVKSIERYVTRLWKKRAQFIEEEFRKITPP